MDIRATPCTAESTAQIKDGNIRLRGHLFLAELSWTYGDQIREDGKFFLKWRSSGLLEIGNESSSFSLVGPDIWPPQEGANFVCLPVFGSQGTFTEIEGLVLEHADKGSNVYQRWGWFSTDSSDIIRHFGCKIINRKMFYTPPEENVE